MFGILILVIITLSGCGENSAEKTAEKFARYWEQKDWNSMYDVFVPDLQKMKTKEEFSEIMNYFETAQTITVRLDKVSLDDGKSYAYFTASTGLFDSKVPALEMQKVGLKWKFNAFATYFEVDLNKVRKQDLETNFISSSRTILKEGGVLLSDISYPLNMYQYEWSTSYCNDFRKASINANNLYEKTKNLKYSSEFEAFYSLLLETIGELKDGTEKLDKDCGHSPREAMKSLSIAERMIIELNGLLDKNLT